MRKHTVVCAVLAIVLAANAAAVAQDRRSREEDVFKGKLFAPELIMTNQDELELSREQYTALRQAVINTQSDVAEHEWDLREAYQALLAGLDETPVDKEQVLEYVDAALAAENQVKKRQVALLIELRNLLTAEQVERLRELDGR